MSMLAAPFTALLKKKFSSRIKRSNKHLAPSRRCYNTGPKFAMILTTDASGSGLGAALHQKRLDGVEKPISFASRGLTAAERNYLDSTSTILQKLTSARPFTTYYCVYQGNLVIPERFQEDLIR
eukprot:GHVP01008767.1.p1 GENE.GHVP01008767.1~~GHVP01008767.1.p1  ORF type:complete len:124 (-),score=18.54 GHVP01008767.1:772-1143(-)